MKYHKQKQKEIYNETIDHGRVTEILQMTNSFTEILPLMKLFKILVYLLYWLYITHNTNIHNLDEGLAWQ